MVDALSYQLKLVDQMSGPANNANKALQKLQQQLKAEEAELSKLNKAQRNLNKGDVVDINTSKVLKQQISAKSNSLASLQQQMVELGQAGAKDIKGAAVETEGLGAALGELAGPAAIAAGAAAALGAAFAGAVIGGASLAIQASEAKEDTIDMLTAMLDSQTAAEDTYAKIGQITSQVAISQGRAIELADELSAAGITNADALTDAIKQIGEAGSVLPRAGAAVQKIIENSSAGGVFKPQAKALSAAGVTIKQLGEQIAKDTGKSLALVNAELKKGTIKADVGIKALGEVIDQKFGKAAANQVNDIGNQVQRLKDNFVKLFEDSKTEGFKKGLADIFSLFDENTAIGSQLRSVVSGIFTGFYKTAEAVLPYVKAGLKGIVIIGLQVAIALKPLIKTIKDAFGGDSKSGVDSFASALSSVGEAIGTVVGWVVKLATNQTVIDGFKTAFYGVAVVVGILAAGVGLLLAPFYALGAAIIYVIGLGEQFVQWALNVGGQVVNGLIQGILGGGAALGSAVANIAHGALDRFKSVFGIHSPSKVMAQMGKHMMSGLSMGIDFGAPAANDTLAAAVEPAPALGKAASGGSTTNHSVGNVTIEITINGVGSVSELKEAMPAIMADALEQAGLTVGAPQAA